MKLELVIPLAILFSFLLVQTQPSDAQIDCNLDSLVDKAVVAGFDEVSIEVLDSDNVSLYGKLFFFSKFSDGFGKNEINIT